MLEWDLKPHMQWPGVMGNYGFGNENDRGFRLLQFCTVNNLFIANTNLKHKTGHRFTLISPEFLSKSMIDYIIIPSRMKNIRKYCRYHSVDIGSEHSLVIGEIVMTPKKPKPLKGKTKEI